MNVFDEAKEVVFSTEEVKNETREKVDTEETDSIADDTMETATEMIRDEKISEDVNAVAGAAEVDGQTFVNSSEAYGYFDEESDKGVIDKHEAYARQGRNQEYYKDPTYHNVRRNYENREYYGKGARGRYLWGNHNGNSGNTYQRPRYNDVYARDNTHLEENAGYSEQQPKYYIDEHIETGRDVTEPYSGIPVYTGRKSRQFETVGCVIRMLDLAGFKLGSRLVLIDKETGEVLR